MRLGRFLLVSSFAPLKTGLFLDAVPPAQYNENHLAANRCDDSV